MRIVDLALIRFWRGLHKAGDPPRRIQLAFDRESARRARAFALRLQRTLKAWWEE